MLVGKDKITSGVFLYTSSYPYGLGETFLEQDLEILCEMYERVVIIPFHTEGIKREISWNNAIVVEFNRSNEERIPLHLLLKSSKKFKSNLSHARENRAYLKNVFSFKNSLLSLMEKHPHTIHFSFWMNEWTILLSYLKKKENFNFICRGHGYDIFSERHSKGYIPFQYEIIKQADKVMLSSEYSKNYLKNKFPEFKNKFHTVQLNPEEHQQISLAPTEKLHFLSVSNLVEVKQVHLIPSFLNSLKTNLPLKWTHIGTGSELFKVFQVLKSTDKEIEFHHLGHLNIEEVVDFYRTNKISAFIHCSASEGGVPLAIKEAFSFGLPLIALPNGGVKEVMEIHPHSFHFNKFEITPELLNTFNRLEIKDAFYQNYSREKAQKLLINFLSQT